MSTKCNCTSIADKKDLWGTHRDKFEVIENKCADFVEKVTLKCKSCNTVWYFQRDDSYHYPIVQWSHKPIY